MSEAYSFQLHHLGCCKVPKPVAACPECGSQLTAESEESDENGAPIVGHLNVGCAKDNGAKHRYWQCDWQPVIETVEKWCGAVSQ